MVVVGETINATSIVPYTINTQEDWMDWLKELLSKSVDADKVDAIDKAISDELPKQFIPKGRFNEVTEELKITKGQLAEVQKSFTEVSKKAESVDDYEKRLKEAVLKNKETEENANKQIQQITKKSQLKELLLSNNAHKDAIDLLVEKYTAEAENNEKGIVNSDKLIEKIKAEKGGLFAVKAIDSTDKDGHKHGTPVDDNMASVRRIMGLPNNEATKK